MSIQYPPRAKNGAEEKSEYLEFSERVIVRLEGEKDLRIATFLHPKKSWSIVGLPGCHVVAEWWPMPAIGTGNQIS